MTRCLGKAGRQGRTDFSEMAKKKAKSLKGIWGQSHERIWNKVGGKTNTDPREEIRSKSPYFAPEGSGFDWLRGGLNPVTSNGKLALGWLVCVPPNMPGTNRLWLVQVTATIEPQTHRQGHAWRRKAGEMATSPVANNILLPLYMLTKLRIYRSA